MTEFTLYQADCCGQAKNTLYPHPVVVKNADDLAGVVAKDHTCGEFKGYKRRVWEARKCKKMFLVKMRVSDMLSGFDINAFKNYLFSAFLAKCGDIIIIPNTCPTATNDDIAFL